MTHIKRLSFCLNYFHPLSTDQINTYFKNIKEGFNDDNNNSWNIKNIQKYTGKNDKTYININLDIPICNLEVFNKYVKKIYDIIFIDNLKVFYTEGTLNKITKQKPTVKYTYQPIYKDNIMVGVKNTKTLLQFIDDDE